jgi:hypothetical protein
MLTRSLLTLLFAIFLGACAHRGAVKVQCDGPLRPINRVEPASAPVSVGSSSDEPPKPPEQGL